MLDMTSKIEQARCILALVNHAGESGRGFAVDHDSVMWSLALAEKLLFEVAVDLEIAAPASAIGEKTGAAEQGAASKATEKKVLSLV